MISSELEQHAESQRMDSRQLAQVIQAFRKQQSAGAFPGGQLVVRRNGKLIVNEAVGVARGFRKSEGMRHQVKPHTPFPAYSCGKPLAATVIALLEDQGKLDVKAPIAEVFPKFARNGKEKITALDVLTHRSGILLPHLFHRMELWGDRELMTRELISAVPIYPRGTLAYGPLEFGWILSEVVRRIDDRGLVRIFAEEIAMPLGLPDLAFGLANRDLNSLAHSYWLGKSTVMVAGFNAADRFEEKHNAKVYFDSLNPACTLITNAASLAIFYDFILAGGIAESGRRLISEPILRRYAKRHAFSFDRSLKTFLALGLGCMVGTLIPSIYGWWNTGQCFGHGGVFSSIAFGDYERNLSVAILTNGNRGNADLARRFIPLNHMIRAACV